MANKFGVGAVGNKIAIVHEVGERLTKAEALNLAANLVARALTLKGSGDVQKELEGFLELVGEVSEDESVAAAVRAELE
jgi:hypothetical protein